MKEQKKRKIIDKREKKVKEKRIIFSWHKLYSARFKKSEEEIERRFKMGEEKNYNWQRTEDVVKFVPKRFRIINPKKVNVTYCMVNPKKILYYEF